MRMVLLRSLALAAFAPPSTAAIPADVLCNSKLLAYEFAQKLMPERSGDGLASVALGLGVFPANKTCIQSGGGGHHPSPPGPPPPPRPVVPRGSCSALMTGLNLVYGWHGNPKTLPTTKDAASCEALCKSQHNCTYGTWHDENQGHYKNRCILMSDNRYNAHRQTGHTSFLCNMTGSISIIPDPNPESIWWAEEERRLDLQPKRHTGWREEVPLLPTEEEAAGKAVYVDANKGSDSAAGTVAAPLKSIQVGVNKVGAAGGGTVFLRAGVFFLSQTVTISHSGVTIAPYQHEEVVVSGGVQITPKWTKIPGTTGLAESSSSNGQTPPKAPVDTYVSSVPRGLRFLELFNASTARLIPARNPDGNSELAPKESNYGFSGKETSCRDFGPARQVIVNDTCPGCVDTNKGQFSSYSVGIGGPADNFFPPISYWAQPHPHGGGANTYDIPAGVSTSANTGLKPGGGGYVFMMQTHHWGSWVYEIADVDAGSGNITFGAGGFQEARGGSGGCGTGSFYLSHRRELLDAPSEWFLDETESKLYTAVAPGGTPPATLFAPTVSVLFRFEGTQSAPVKDSRVSSLTLRHAAPTYMANYSVGSGGDYSVHRNGAVTMTGTENCTVDHNLFDGVGGNGVWLHAYNRYALVSANEMRNIGENGVGLTGETVWVDGTGGNQPRHNQISGNLINHLGLYTKQACAVFSAVSCQNLIEANVFWHGPRALFNMNDDFGGDTIIRQNLFFKSLLETSDHGPYNSWDRLPFLTTVFNGSSTIVSAYNHLEANMFFSGSPFAIDTDDGSDRVNCTSNVVVSTPLFKTDFSGHTKTFQRNVDLFGACGGSEPGTNDHSNIFTGNKCVGDGSPAGPRSKRGSPPPPPGTCVPCKTPCNGRTIPKAECDCPLIEKNMYYTGANGTTAKTLCGPGYLEAGSQMLPVPADGGIALCKEALGMPM